MRAWLLAMLLLAAAAAAHGGTKVTPLDSGPYRVYFFGFEFITAGELLTLGWNVTDRASGERLPVRPDEARAEAHFFDTKGALVNRTQIPLSASVAGFLTGNLLVGPEGRAQFDLQLSGGTVSHEQEVLPASTGFQPPPPASTPAAPWALVLPLLALAALARRRQGPG